jgi:ribosomal-protein-alanine N-acetyltransferase
MILDPARPEDAAAMSAIHASGFVQPWSAPDLAALLEAPGGYGLVVREADGRHAATHGFILARVVADEAEVLTLAVDPAARRQGVARALIEGAAGAALNAGAAALFLEVAADNAPAIQLYETAGFERVGLRPNYYHRGGETTVDALVLRRTLNSRTG